MDGKIVSLLIFLALISGVLAGYAFSNSPHLQLIPTSSNSACIDANVQSVISPGADAKIISLMDSAKVSIHITLFEFSFSDLKEALVNAADRGVSVKLILDPKVDQNLDTADFLKSKGIVVRWSPKKFNYSHAKTAIIDGKTVLTGSINWSRNAMTRNREIGVIIEDDALATELEGIFEQDWLDGTKVI